MRNSQIPHNNPPKPVEEDDEPDEWEKTISDTGCAAENEKLQDCFYEKKDWRECKDEMQAFRQCWQEHGNNERTATKDAPKS